MGFLEDGGMLRAEVGLTWRGAVRATVQGAWYTEPVEVSVTETDADTPIPASLRAEKQDLAVALWFPPRPAARPRILDRPYAGLWYGWSHRSYAWNDDPVVLEAWMEFMALEARLPVRPLAWVPTGRWLVLEPFFQFAWDIEHLQVESPTTGEVTHDVGGVAVQSGFSLGFSPVPRRRP